MKKTLWEKAKLLFDMRGGELDDQELCLNFNDSEVHSLFMGGYIEPSGVDRQWIWVKSQAAQR